jgi:hypothetical protein
MNQKHLNNLLALGEGFTTEFKRSVTTYLGREICAFVNSTGGGNPAKTGERGAGGMNRDLSDCWVS